MSKDKKKSGITGGTTRAPGAARLQGGVDTTGSRGAPLWARVFVWCVLGAAGVLALWALVLTSSQTAEISRFAEQGWGQYAPVIVGNKMRALWHAAFMMAVVGIALWWMVVRRTEDRCQRTEVRGQRTEDRRQKLCSVAGVGDPGIDTPGSPTPATAEVCGLRSAVFGQSSVIPMLLVIIVALDAWWLSRNYVKTMPMSALEANPVIAILKQDMPEHRVALISQDGFYNWWLTYLFPYHGILTVNITQMPRMPADYKAFLGAVGRNPLRMWQLSAVGYVLAPAQVWQQIRHDPAWSNAFELVYGYNVGPAQAGVSVIPVWSSSVAGVVDPGKPSSTRPATAEQPPPPADVGQHVVLRLTRPAPRFALIGAVREVADDEVLKLLGSPSYPLFTEVLLASAVAGVGDPGSNRPHRGRLQNTNDVPEPDTGATLTNAGFVGACRLLNYRPGRMEIEVKADKAGMLRVSEKYDKDWKATVDGAPVPVQRVDYIMQGVSVPAGEHKVLLRYAPALWPIYLQGAGLLIVLGAGVWLVVGWFRGQRTED